MLTWAALRIQQYFSLLLGPLIPWPLWDPQSTEAFPACGIFKKPHRPHDIHQYHSPCQNKMLSSYQSGISPPPQRPSRPLPVQTPSHNETASQSKSRCITELGNTSHQWHISPSPPILRGLSSGLTADGSVPLRLLASYMRWWHAVSEKVHR